MKVLIGYDGSNHANAAIDDLTRAGLPRGSEVLVASVADFSTGRPAVSEFNLISAASRRIDTMLEQVRYNEARVLRDARSMTSGIVHRLRRQFPSWKVNSEILSGSPAEELLRKAHGWDADLVVVGSQGRSAIGRFFLGSVSKTVAENAAASVRVVCSGDRKPDGRPLEIILGIRNPSEAERIIQATGRRVWPAGTRVHVVAVDDGVSAGRLSAFYPHAETIYETAAERLSDVCLDVSVQVVSGDPETVLINAAKAYKADVIFVTPGAVIDAGALDDSGSALITGGNFTIEIVR